MNLKRTFLSLLVTLMLIFAMTACGTKNNSSSNTDSLDQKSADEIEQMITEIQDKEASIFQEHEDLWKIFFDAMDENPTTMELTEDYTYGNYLLEGLKTMEDRFSEEEYKLLQEDANQILKLEKELQPLSAKQEELSENTKNSDFGTDSQAFPAFEGTDFDGNKIDSSIFSKHSVTVMNFWFTTCKPCVEELEDLENLSKKLEEKNGVLIGVNAFTQDGDKQAIAEAKEVLDKKGVTYPNIYFGSESEAGKFAEQISVFPSTYVFDKNGVLVGEPIIGGINTPEQMEKLEKLIDAALEK